MQNTLVYPLLVLLEAVASWAGGMVDVEWAEEAGRAAVGSREGITIEARVVGREVLVTAATVHMSRRRRAWATTRVLAWDGTEDWDVYRAREGQRICDTMGRKLAMRDR